MAAAIMKPTRCFSRSVGRNFPPSGSSILRAAALRSFARDDPVNLPAILQIFKIRILRDTDQALLYAAETKEDFGKLVFSEGLLSHLDEFGLLLLSPGPDPQIYLPLFGPGRRTMHSGNCSPGPFGTCFQVGRS